MSNSKTIKTNKNKFDLSKLKIKELPKSTVKADLGEGEQEFDITALNDSQRMCISLLYSGKNDPARPIELYVLLLAFGLDCLEQDRASARYIVDNALDQAVIIGDAIYDLTNSFYEAKEKESDEAEKNSQSGKTEDTQVQPEDTQA